MVYILWFILGLTAILLVVDFLRSLIETFAKQDSLKQGYEAVEGVFLIRLFIFSVIMGILVFAKMYFVDFG